MANTYSRIILHIVFAVKGRAYMLKGDNIQRVHAYMATVLRDMGHYVYTIGGIEDHVHILLGYKISQPIPDMIRELKIATTKFINDQNLITNTFAWQQGYACFSYSPSQIDAVKKYIDHQPEHHHGLSFRDEMVKMCELFGINFEFEYLPGWSE